MADEQAPIVVRRQKPGEPPAFEQELQGRASAAQDRFKAAHPELFPPPVQTETTPLPITEPEEAAPPTTLPTIEEPVPEPVEEPKPEPAPAPAPAPEPVPEAAKPPAPEAPKAPPENFDWRSFRRMERENRRLQRELEAAKKNQSVPSTIAETQPAPTPTPAPSAESQPPSAAPPSDDDPLGIRTAVKEAVGEVERRYEEREQQRAQREQENEQRRYADEIDRSEREFSTTHPDYYDAVNHIANWERQRYQLSGAANAKAAEMLNDQQWIPTIEKVADEFVFVPDSAREGVLLTARRDQLTPVQLATAREMSDAEAAVCLATDLWIRDRRNDILQGARAQRRAVPDVVWDLATKVAGYQARQAATTSALTETAPGASGGTQQGYAGVPSANGKTPAERIRQQARVNAATRTLSNLSSGLPGEPQQLQIRSLAEFVEFHRRDPAGARAYADRMSRIDPNWQRNLQG